MRVLGIFVLLAVFVFMGCHDDEGNYSYRELNEPTVDSLAWSYALVYGDPLEIKPVLTFPLGENPNVNYEWVIGDSIYARTKDLKIEKFERIGYTSAFFIVEEQETGIRYMNQFTIDVTAPYQEGWLMLAEENGKSKLMMVRVLEQEKNDGTMETVYTEIVDVNPEVDYGSSPKRIMEHWAGAFSASGLGEIVVLNAEGDSYELEGEGLLPVVSTSQEFSGEVFPAGFSPIDALYLTHFSFLLSSDNKLYFRQNKDVNAYHTGYYSSLPMEGPQGMEIGFFIPSVYCNTYQGLFYDKQNRRYLLWTDSYYEDLDPNEVGKLCRLNQVDKYPEGFSNLDNLGMDAVYVGACDPSYYTSYYFAILKSDEGKYYMQQFSATNSWGRVSAKPDFQAEFPETAKLQSDSRFAVMYNGDKFVFTSGNELYVATRSNKENMKFIQYTNYKGGKIVQLKENTSAKHLGVVDENGKFYVLDLASTELANGGKVLYESTNSFGKVVDMIYKYGSRSLWQNGW